MAELPRDAIYHYEYDGKGNINIKITDLIRCKDCKYRKVNEHYGEKGYSKLKAICELDTGDIFQLGRYAEEDDWFCADAKRREGDADAD